MDMRRCATEIRSSSQTSNCGMSAQAWARFILLAVGLNVAPDPGFELPLKCLGRLVALHSRDIVNANFHIRHNAISILGGLQDRYIAPQHRCNINHDGEWSDVWRGLPVAATESFQRINRFKIISAASSADRSVVSMRSSGASGCS